MLLTIMVPSSMARVLKRKIEKSAQIIVSFVSHSDMKIVAETPPTFLHRDSAVLSEISESGSS